MRSRARIEIPARLFFCARGLDATVRRKAHCPLTGFLARKCPIIRLGAWHPKPNVQKRRDRGRSPLLSSAPGSTAPGPGRCPGSKVRTLFEGAHPFRKVSILENPEDSFEDAHLFRRCAPKTAHLRTALARGSANGRRRHSSGEKMAKHGQNSAGPKAETGMLRDLSQARRLPASILASNRRPSCARRLGPVYLNADFRFAIERTH